jgi:hypothetical protein
VLGGKEEWATVATSMQDKLTKQNVEKVEKDHLGHAHLSHQLVV